MLKNLPKEYNIQCQVIHIEISARKLLLQIMWNQVELQYDDLSITKTSLKNGCRKFEFSDSNSDSTKGSMIGTEDALLATKLKGRCRKCGQYIYKGADFLEKKSESCASSTTKYTTAKFNGKLHEEGS